MKLAGLVLLALLVGSAAAQAPAAAPLELTPPEPTPADHAPTGRPILHDPSTIIREGNWYYVFSSGRGIPFFVSHDLHTWFYRGAIYNALPHSVVKYVPGNDGLDAWAPDIIKVGDTYFAYYSVSKWEQYASAIALATNTTLDPKNPNYKWVDHGMLVRSTGQDYLNAIDPGVILTTDGKMWLCYGSFKGPIELMALNPKTGLLLHPHSLPYQLALDSEASDIIEHDGWFYLFVNHGSCCHGAGSTYHINVGRSRKITGPYVDRKGKSLMDSQGEPFLATEGEHMGPGHFGLIPAADGIGERFSIHYEADTGSNDKPVLAIRKLSWSADGWPVAGTLQ